MPPAWASRPASASALSRSAAPPYVAANDSRPPWGASTTHLKRGAHRDAARTRPGSAPIDAARDRSRLAAARYRSRAASIGTAAAAAPAGAPATAPFAPTVDGLAELARKVESERLAIYRAQIGVDGPRALDGKSYSELSLGVI